MDTPRLNIIAVDPSLRSTGAFTIKNGQVNSYVIQDKRDRLNVLGAMLKIFNLEAKEFDLLIIEDYAFSRQSRSVTVQAELGGVIRSCFAARGKKIIEVPIATWKSATGIKGDKVGSTGKSDYLNQVAEKYKIRFLTTDEADAFLLYMAVRLSLQLKAKSIGESIRDQASKIGLVADQLT